MLPCTTEFLTAADYNLRRPIGKLEITWSDALIEPASSIVVGTDNRGSLKDQVADVKDYPSYKYTLLDGTWVLGQDLHLGPETAEEIASFQIGYYGNQVSNSSTFAFPTAETIEVNISSRTINGVFIAGDHLLNEYPTQFTMRIYSGVTVLYSDTVTNNSQVDIFYSGQYLNVTKLELEITHWSTGDTCCKILEFFTTFVATYYGTDIINMNLLEQREVRDATIPIGNMASNELSFTIQNFEYGLGERVADGDVLYVKSDVQDVTQWSVYRIVNGGTPSLIDTYYCPTTDKNGGYYWHFVYQYTIPSYTTGTSIKLYFEPSGADIGKPGAFYSDLWVIGDIVYEPYNNNNPSTIFSAFLKPNRRIKAYLGFCLPNGSCEYLQLGTFWNNDWVLDNDKLTLSTDSRDRLGVLKDSIFDKSPLYINKTIYYIIDDILTFAKTYIPMLDLTWEIDSVFDSLTIPYAYFDKVSYFDALRDLIEVGLGQCYMSREDVLIVESYDKNLYIDAPSIYLTKDSHYKVNQKYSYIEILNKIYINYYGFTLESSTEIYRTKAIDIDASETLEPIEINLSDPIKDVGAYASIEDETGSVVINIDSEEYYSWGGIITCSETSGNAGTFTIAIHAEKLVESDKFTKIISDLNSIDEFSERVYEFPDNKLIQGETYASLIGTACIDTYADPRSDITVNYPGNPAIELSDTMRVTVYKRDTDNVLNDFIIYKGELKFDGTLIGILYGKRQQYLGEIGESIQDSDNALFTSLYQDTDNATEEWQDTDN